MQAPLWKIIYNFTIENTLGFSTYTIKSNTGTNDNKDTSNICTVKSSLKIKERGLIAVNI